MNDQKLEDEFHRAMVNVYRNAEKCGYRANRFRRTVGESGGLSAAQQWLSGSTAQSGLDKLWELEVSRHFDGSHSPETSIQEPVYQQRATGGSQTS